MSDSLSKTAERLDQLGLEAAANRDALNPLFELARPRLMRIIGLRTPRELQSRVDIEDIVQEVFSRATQRFEMYASRNPVPVFIWLRGLAIDLLIEQKRKHLGAECRAVSREIDKGQWLRETSLAMTRIQDSGARSPSAIVADRQRGVDLRSALEKLPENYREVLVLRFFESLSVAEAAAAMDCSVANAKVLQFRAIKKLQDVMRAEFGWDSLDQLG
ncbi:MAG: sigma-70 family RNA polymerase sigma factor [Planctomycetota bacterium]